MQSGHTFDFRILGTRHPGKGLLLAGAKTRFPRRKRLSSRGHVTQSNAAMQHKWFRLLIVADDYYWLSGCDNEGFFFLLISDCLIGILCSAGSVASPMRSIL
ncbi:hypothetical protein SAE02_14490 [Skermanella aerolata]|uniref:Uncharacterized protein n=1 Tax=Skermanella aerolata TaxID=393310 RepID=A0A512DLE7_9PROT|nr:hypothetical protein N826_20500 [Skermanella aerolata KACC 11604]GEO37301.1 hypothetical protein SAE02_14490 [Skermanella aerolata]